MTNIDDWINARSRKFSSQGTFSYDKIFFRAQYQNPQSSPFNFSSLVDRALHINSECEILKSCRSIILPLCNIKDSFMRAFAIRHAALAKWSIVIQVSFKSSDLQTSTVSFYALANSVSSVLFLDGDLFFLFRPFY